MKFYIKNTNTNEIIELEAHSYEMLSRNFRTAPYELASDEEQADKILQEAKQTKIAQCKAYLTKTDWQVVRFSETQTPIDSQVLTNRGLARNNQDLIEDADCDTLEKLNNINTNFN